MQLLHTLGHTCVLVTFQFSQDSMVFQILYKVPLLSTHVIFNILKKVKNDIT